MCIKSYCCVLNICDFGDFVVNKRVIFSSCFLLFFSLILDHIAQLKHMISLHLTCVCVSELWPCIGISYSMSFSFRRMCVASDSAAACCSTRCSCNIFLPCISRVWLIFSLPFYRFGNSHDYFLFQHSHGLVLYGSLH